MFLGTYAVYSRLINQGLVGFRIFPTEKGVVMICVCVHFSFPSKVREGDWSVVSSDTLIYAVFYCERKQVL